MDATLHPDPDPDPECHAEPAQSIGSMFMGAVWFKLAPMAPDAVMVRGGGWCQGLGVLRFDEWTAHPTREAAGEFVRQKAREFLTATLPPLEPAQEKCRQELLAKLDGTLDTRPWAQPLEAKSADFTN